MDQLNNDLRECVNLLDSSKITERRKKCSDLQDYLQRQDMINLLNTNSRNKEGVTWDAVLVTAHRGLLKEADKIRDEEQKGKGLSRLDNPKASFSGLISTITSKANTGGEQRLSAGQLLQCVLGVLQERFLSKHFATTYLRVLRHQILPCHHYCASVGEENWKDLLQLCEQLYKNPPPKVDNNLILSTLSLIIKKGGKHSFLALEVKKKFPFIIECIKADASSPNLQENLAQLALSICQTLQYECRMSICKFGEEVMSDLRNMYDHRETGASRKKDMLLEWFELQVRAHHPGGARRGCPGAYAGAWDVWVRQLGWLYQLVTAEVTSLLRHRSACRTLNPKFVSLAICVCKQMFETGDRHSLDMSLISNLQETSMAEAQGAAKRIRLETGVAAVVDRVAATPQQDMWPWLSLLTAMCWRHPELVSEADVISLLQLCAENLQTCKDITTTENLYRCCDALLFVEDHKDTKLMDTIRLKELWENVWDTALRAVGLSLCEEWCHTLVSRLVRSRKPLPADRLLQLYVSGAVHRSDHSLRTLRAVTETHCVVEMLGVKQCKTLMDWVVPSREETSADWTTAPPSAELAAGALVALTIKTRAPACPPATMPATPAVTGTEKLYLYTALEGGLVTGDCGGNTGEKTKEELLPEPELSSHLTLVLTREHFAVKEWRGSGVVVVHTLAAHTRLLAHVERSLREWGLAADNSLQTYLAESCDRMAEAIKDILMRHSDIPTITAVLGRLVDLLQLIADMQSADLLHRLATSYVIKACNKLAVVSQRVHQQNNDFDFEEMEITPANLPEDWSPVSEETVQGWAHVQLTAYRCVLQVGRLNPDLMIRLLELPTSGNCDVAPTTALHMALSAARTVCSLSTVGNAVASELLSLLQHLCRQWHANDSATIAILDIFQGVKSIQWMMVLCIEAEMLESSIPLNMTQLSPEDQGSIDGNLSYHLARSPDDNNWSNYIVLVSGIHRFIQRRKYGAHVLDRFVCLLGHIAQVDESGQWTSRMTDDGNMRPLAHELLSFLTSPFHQVRMAACQKIWTLFSSSTIQQQQLVFNDLLTVSNDVFIIQGELGAEEQLEEGVVRTASALHTLAPVLAVTSCWRARALLQTCVLTAEKSLNTELVRRMLTVVASHLDIPTLSELTHPLLPAVVWLWHERYTSLARFPWLALGYASELKFYQAAVAGVVTVLIHRRDTETLNHVANVMGQSVSQLVQTCYPVLLGSILPRFADENQQQTATIIISIVEKYLGDDKVNSLMVSKMGDVLTNMLGSLYDPEWLKTLCGQLAALPEPTRLSFTTDLVLGGVHYIQENSPKSKTPLLVYLSQEKPRLIQKTLLKLYAKVHHTKIPEYKLLYLHQFLSMCELVVSVIDQPQFRMAHFTITWLARVLLHLIHGETGLLAVSYLHKFLATVLPSHSALVDSLLSALVSELVPLASQENAIGRKVLSVLELLLVTHASSLPSVANLDPLPSEPMFAAMSQQYVALRYAAPLSTSLRAEIQHTLNTARDRTCRSEGLRHLRKQLSGKKAELAQLYAELRATRGFSEDCETSELHRLITRLITVTAGPDPEARYEAACCLGELGPADLTTLGLKPDAPASSAPPLDLFLRTVLAHLTQYLHDADITVVQATSDALYTLFGNYSQQINGLLTPQWSQLLYPFTSSARGVRSTVSVDEDALATVIPSLCPDDVCSHQRWVCSLVNAILNTVQFGFLIPVVEHKEELANELFPVIVDFVLEKSSVASTKKLFVDQINEFFSRHMSHSSTDEVYGNRNSVFAMLKVVDSVRKHIDEERVINYLHVSKAALFCSAYFTAVMYAELWASEFNSNREDLDVEGVSQLEFIEERDNANGQLLQNLLREAYMKIGEPDAVYGCGNTHLLDPHNLIQHYQYEGQWLRVVEASDLQLSLQPSLHIKGFESALHLSGLHYLAGKVSSRQSYEAAWRLGQWDLPQPGPSDQSHAASVYQAVRALRDGDTARALSVVRQARCVVVESLAHTSMEAATNIYAPLARLRALQEIEDFATLDFLQVDEKWHSQDKIGWSKFTDIEPVLAQRMTLLKLAKDLDQERQVTAVTKLCDEAKAEGFHSVAHGWLTSLPLARLPPHLRHRVQLLQAQSYWDKRETDTARHLLRRLLGQLKESEQTTLYARALHTYGSLVARTRTEQAQQILDRYLIPAVIQSDNEFKLSAALSLARYADAEYQTLLGYVKSSVYASKIDSITASVVSAERLTKAAASVATRGADVDHQTKVDLRKTINMHDKQSKIDQQEVETAQRELDNFLLLAIRHYLLSLELGDRQQLCVFRVVSLWLNNCGNEEVEGEMAQRLSRVPSHKVLAVLPQLAARISDDAAPATTTLTQLIERCARDHPHHVLPLIMALANTYKDADYTQSTINTGAKPEIAGYLKGRVVGAQKMLDKLKQKETLKTLIRDMQKVAEAYTSLAYLAQAQGSKDKVYKIPKSEPITKLKNLNHVLCPTVTLTVSKSANYDDIIGIQGYGETYYPVGGINAPKKIHCICTDGVKRPQLVKGNDDLRQDAVMQQVFTIMNTLLSENKETQRRRLLIRTYKVVPLSQRSGVIEWCVNTTPLAHYLVGGGGVPGAHVRYRRHVDWLPAECREKTAQAAKANHSTKLRVFKEICAHFKPVFRHFFFEKFPNPGIWFERKLAYTHSVATSSMVGYILGLGDRHVLNILIDERTAEVIHIDFGIAFEQGRTLITPETVPFRLTRDIIDGMGVSGVEGVFRRSCEKTMEVMRECESTIVTILEVLLYDPLYMWTITPAMAMAKQGGKRTPASQTSQGTQERGQANKLAERALLRLKQKLQGIEEGSPTSVEGQVSKLIQEATNPANLCRLFHGWQAHV